MSGAPDAGEPDPLSPEAYTRMTLVLRAGLAVAVGILLGALVAYLVTHPNATSQAILASNPIVGYLNPEGLYQGLVNGHRQAYLTLGLLVLLATPILRVVTGAYYFYKDGERAMAAIASTVFVLLIFGLVLIGPYIP
jgi:uncharacterized membrane protein